MNLTEHESQIVDIHMSSEESISTNSEEDSLIPCYFAKKSNQLSRYLLKISADKKIELRYPD